MAEYSQNIVADEQGNKLSEDDKCKIYESSTDSGFISSTNLILSSDDIPCPEDAIAEESEEKEIPMRSDSGVDVCLTESFQSLNLSPGLNDLNFSKKTFSYPAKSTTTIPENVPATTKVDDIPWELFYKQDEDGDTQLHTAILSEFLEVVIALIRGAPYPHYLDVRNGESETPLHLATAMGLWRIVRWLLVAGARPSIRNRRGDTALHVAARMGNLDCVRAILAPVHKQERAALNLRYPPSAMEPVELDTWNYSGQTCVHVAAIEGHVDILRHLVWYGADINAKDMTCGYTALHFAAEDGNENVIKYLMLECKQLNYHALTYQGYSAVDLAVPYPQVEDDLRSRGVESNCSTGDEYDDSDSETEKLYESSNIYNQRNLLINASA